MVKHFLTAVLLLQMAACKTAAVNHPSAPWQNKPQPIPGRVECEWYDEGGEGVAYHDADPVNNGSGKLNPANGMFLNEFRMQEGADISYTKPGGIDDNPYNKTMPALHQLYLGWTQPGEWVNYSVKVAETALYRVSVMYTANKDGAIALSVDGRKTTAALKIPSTYDARDTVAWRQWHHWNKLEALTSISLKKGIHHLTLHITEQGNMNFDYLEFNRQ